MRSPLYPQVVDRCHDLFSCSTTHHLLAKYSDIITTKRKPIRNIKRKAIVGRLPCVRRVNNRGVGVR